MNGINEWEPIRSEFRERVIKAIQSEIDRTKDTIGVVKMSTEFAEEVVDLIGQKRKPLQISSGLTYCGACRLYLPRPSTAHPRSWNFCAWCGSGIDWTNVVPEDRGPWLYREGTEAKDDATD